MRKKQDVRMHCSQELVLLAANDEYLYGLRHNTRALKAAIGEMFEYTGEQLEELNQYLEDEQEDEQEG